MARRAQSKIQPLWMISAILIVGLAAGGGMWLMNQADDPFRGVEAMNLSVYQSNANSLIGNVYKLDARVVTLISSHGNHRLYEVEVVESNRPVRLAIAVPDSLGANLQAEQRFFFQVKVMEGGMLLVQRLTKA